MEIGAFLGAAIDTNAEQYYADRVDGNVYTFDKLLSGAYWISIDVPGYQRQLLKLWLTSDSAARFEVVLERQREVEATVEYGSSRDLEPTPVNPTTSQDKALFGTRGMIIGAKDLPFQGFTCQYMNIDPKSAVATQEICIATVDANGAFTLEAHTDTVLIRAWGWHNRNIWSMPWTKLRLQPLVNAQTSTLVLHETFPVIIEPTPLGRRLELVVLDEAGCFLWRSVGYADIPRRFRLLPGAYTVRCPNGEFPDLRITMGHSAQRVSLLP